MSDIPAQPLDAARWALLKDHVADLNELHPAERAAALAALPLDDTDRTWLAQLVSPQLTNDARLRAPHPSAREAAAGDGLRCHSGDEVGRYRIEGLLGRGGMGEVYEATSMDDGQLVALKVLRLGLAESDYARFSENEQRALRRLNDPRIARFVEAFVAPDVGACLVLEYVDGEPLQNYCCSRRFNVEARLKLFIDVCHAVASAHQQLVVHRDLKPSNVLVTPEGHVKLLDFGVAKLLDDDSTPVQPLTQTHGDLFTLDYAAPEQVLRERVSTVTDVYALGVLLYRLLADVSPYARVDGASLAKAVLHESPQRLAAGMERARASGQTVPGGALDRDLDGVIAHAMEKEPRNRYRSALELASDVQAVLDGRAIHGGGGALYRVGKFARRHRAMVTAATVATLALIAATGVSLYSAKHASEQAHRAEVANRFLLTTLDLTDRFSGNNRNDFTLSDVLERAVAKARTELHDEPEVRANVLVQMSLALQHRGKLDAALAAAREAYGIRGSQADGDPAEFAAAAQQLGSLEIESGYLDAADGHLNEALKKLALAGPQQRALIETYTSLGKLASMRGDAVASLRWYQQIVPLRELLQGDHALDLAMDYNNLGTGLHYLSRFSEAEQAYNRGINLLTTSLGAKHPRIAYIQFSRISPLVQLGRFEEANALLDTVESTLSADGNPVANTPSGINTERARASLEFFASNYTGALHRFDSVLAQTRSASPINVAGTLIWRGRIELASRDYTTAAATFTESKRLYAENGRANHLSSLYAQGLHGVAVAALGRTADGDAELDAALTKTIGDGSRASAEQVDLLLYAGAAQRRRGELASALGTHRKAQAMQADIGWLGELGKARVAGELALDALAGPQGASFDIDATAQLASAIEVIARISPHDPQLTRLRAAQSEATSR